MPFTAATKNLDENTLQDFTNQAHVRYTELDKQGENINVIMSALSMDWQGPAQTAFDGQYRRWQEGYNGCLTSLAELTRGLIQAAESHIESETNRDISIQGSDFGAASINGVNG